MTLSRVLIVSVSFVCADEAVSQDTSPVHGRQPAISVSLRAEHNMAKAGTPITLKKTLTNQSDHAVAFGMEVNHPGCAVDVIDESGQFAPDKKPGYRRGRYDPQQLARTLSPEQLAKSGFLKELWGAELR